MFHYLSMFNVERLRLDPTLELNRKLCGKHDKIYMNADKCSECDIEQLESDSINKDMKKCHNAMKGLIENFAPKIRWYHNHANLHSVSKYSTCYDP